MYGSHGSHGSQLCSYRKISNFNQCIYHSLICTLKLVISKLCPLAIFIALFIDLNEGYFGRKGSEFFRSFRSKIQKKMIYDQIPIPPKYWISDPIL